MRKRVLKPDKFVSLSQSVEIPDYIPPSNPASDAPEVNLSEIDDLELKERYNAILENAKIEAENVSAKIISNAEAEKDKIISDAEEHSDMIIKSAKMKSQNIMQNVMKEAEQIRADAYNEGLNSAVKEKSEAVDSILKELKNTIEDMKASQLDYFKRYEKELKYLAVDIAGKVVMNKIDENEMFLLKLVSQNMRAIRDAEWITVEISEKLPQLAVAVEEEMKVCGMSRKTEVRLSEDFSKDSCILRANDRIVDISLQTQLDNIKAYFEKCDETDD